MALRDSIADYVGFCFRTTVALLAEAGGERIGCELDEAFADIGLRSFENMVGPVLLVMVCGGVYEVQKRS